ncbi:uncharacterized protein LOC115621645 [Scaptodrosophila lebanonensis]|uniref:Uncharacterized protein LOC115621645 n=1 Tax=Drosophila lebanonensis TaxID=7225 RepID=A0A6J2T2Q7_DROLE|nr:uncharacterized protein LOC115621645 [Scaptodrosophila lebanonensis]
MSKSKALRNKIRELADANKIDPRDEQELNQLQEAVEGIYKTFEILQAENAHLKRKVNDLQGKAMEAEYLSHDLSANLNHQNAMIDNMENDMEDMQKYYEREVEQSKFNEEVLKCRCDQLKEELMNSKCAAQSAECLQIEVDVLRNELRKRDVALNAYDCQYQQLMRKSKMFRKTGYRLLDVLPESGNDSCFSGAEEEEGGECTC